MSLVSDIISDAYRQGNLTAVGRSPTSDESAEALRYLNRIVSSVLGTEVGDPLSTIPLGNTGISRPNNFPFYGDNPSGQWFVPKNTRLVLNLNDSLDVYLHPMPNAGSRFAVNDIAGNLSTNQVTVYGNGRNIEGSSSLVLNTDSVNKEWFFREDQGTWVVVSPLTADDDFPFPQEFDDFFITMLAMRINPANGITTAQEAGAALQRGRNQLRARYKQTIPVSPQMATYRLTNTSRDRYLTNYDYGYDQPSLGDAPSYQYGFGFL